MDVIARGLLAAAAMIEDGGLERGGEGALCRLGDAGGAGDADERSRDDRGAGRRDGLDPQPRSGRQERLENWVNRFV